MSYLRKIRMHASEDRLEKLIEERLLPGADKIAIDARIWDLFGEDWAIMYTDLSGFSRKSAEFGIIHFLQVIHESKKLLVPFIEHFDGILLKMEGDSMMIIFRNPKKAVECGIAMQHALKKYNVGRNDNEQVRMGLGIGYGKVIRIGDDDVFGSEVNASSKLGEDTSKAWEILVTETVQKTLDKQFKFEKIDFIPPGAKAAYKLNYAV